MDQQPPPPQTTTTTSLPSTNPPSVEAAYKRKCIALKKRLNEIETENENIRLRNRRGWQYIHKMRLESCILLERLANVTGMPERGNQAQAQAQGQGQMQTEDQDQERAEGQGRSYSHSHDHGHGQEGVEQQQQQQQVDSGNSKSTAMADEVNHNADAAPGAVDGASWAAEGRTGNGNGNGRYLEDDTEGSSDEQPPTVCIHPHLSPSV